jgi:hypothetical protein
LFQTVSEHVTSDGERPVRRRGGSRSDLGAGEQLGPGQFQSLSDLKHGQG